MSAHDIRPRIIAVLGPTNTGKTFLAIERMLDHDSGMIGFPLRLLARENYDRVVRLKGARHVALVTGEEKIIPPSARYFVCTVESMPLDRPVAFLAVDEIQMAADPERGHVFTDRLLRARGEAETMLLGADTIRPIIRRLVPEAEFVSRPRLSRLSYTGPKKITRLPPRSAVVVFSANEVYEIAELIRRQRGGTAVVLGALSPRTRNAQVAMYQAGEVDYMVATDAIGMGLNMNVDHVAFARLTKFDGRHARRLTVPEIAQIAGRAGRHMTNGSFGTVSELGPMDADVVEAVENHSFEPLTAIQWRNADLRFSSVRALLKSLDAQPDMPALMRAREADDRQALAQLARDAEIAAMATNRGAVRLLWDVCQIPDFRKTMAEAHTRLLARIYRHLMGPEGRLPADWIADQLARLDRMDGDIDTLMARIAHVRTWTFVSHRGDWLDDNAHWQERARSIEDRLSDALHDRLTQRFVDRRSTALSRLKDKDSLSAAVGGDGEVFVEGEFVGRLTGFYFVPDSVETAEAQRTLMAAANRVLRGEIAVRVGRLTAEPDEAFSLDDDARIAWRGAPVARLRPGDGALAPRIDVMASDYLEAEQRERVRDRLTRWLAGHLAAGLGPLLLLRDADISGPARGIAFRLVEGLGSLPRRAVRSLIAGLTADDRVNLRRIGVRLGLESIFVPALVKPRAARLRALLWAVHKNTAYCAPPPPGLNSAPPETGASPAFYEACGYRVVGGRAVRVDILDRLAIQLRQATRKQPFALSPEMVSQIGLSADQTADIVVALGYEAVESETGPLFRRAKRRTNRKDRASGGPPRPGRRGKPPAGDPDSPFAKLRELRLPS